MTRPLAAVVTAGLMLTACSAGDSGTPTSPAPDSGMPEDNTTSAAADGNESPVTVNGEPLDLSTDICAVGGAFGTEDDRQFSAVGPDGFPSFTLELFMPDTYSATYSDESAYYRTNDSADFDVAITPTGATGTVQMDDTSGASEDITVAFDFSCDDAESEVDTDTDPDAESTDGGESGDTEAAAKTGYVEWAGARSDLADDDFDPMAGTGLCETHDATGTSTGDYYRISTRLDDGTDFFLTSRDGLRLGDTFAPVETTEVSVTQDDRTVTGSAQTPDGPIEFGFTC